MSEQIGELAKALVAAQEVMQNADKDRVNPHFKNRYATLGSVLDACKGPLNANGIAILQMPCGTSDDCAAVETMLLHVSGQSISRVNAMPVVKKDPQGHASAITYLRRYGLLAITGLTADDDDDGNEASRKPEPRREQAPATKQAQTEDFRSIAITAGRDKGKTIGKASDEGLDEWQAIIERAVNNPDAKLSIEARARAMNTVEAIKREKMSR